MPSPEPPDSLSATLRAWRLRPHRHPQFRPGVWARIAAARRAESWAGYVRVHARAVVAGLTLAVLAGALAGRQEARLRVAESSAQLAKAYVTAHDARAMQMP